MKCDGLPAVEVSNLYTVSLLLIWLIYIYIIYIHKSRSREYIRQIYRYYTLVYMSAMNYDIICIACKIKCFFVFSIFFHLFVYTFKFQNRQLNSSPPSAAYMRQWIELALVQTMACCLFGAMPLSKPMLGYCQLNPLEQNFSDILIRTRN